MLNSTWPLNGLTESEWYNETIKNVFVPLTLFTSLEKSKKLTEKKTNRYLNSTINLVNLSLEDYK